MLWTSSNFSWVRKLEGFQLKSIILYYVIPFRVSLIYLEIGAFCSNDLKVTCANNNIVSKLEPTITLDSHPKTCLFRAWRKVRSSVE